MHTILNDNLEKYLEERLPADVQASLDAHIAECHDCRAELNEMLECRQMLSLLAVTADDPALEPMPGFALKVMVGIETPAPSQASAPWWKLTLIRQLALAGAMLALLSSGYFMTLKSTEASATAELLSDLPTYRQAPAAVFSHHHQKNEKGMCLACWKSSRVTTASSYNDDVREVAMASLISDGE